MNANFPKYSWLICFLALNGCGSATERNPYQRPEASAQNEAKALSLSEDRAHLSELRKDIPADVKKENDDLSFLLNLFADEKRSTESIRQDFTQTIRKRRELIDKSLKREREAFDRSERKNRDEFLNAQTRERTQFKEKKSTREESRDFYKEIEQKRTDYFVAEREQRNDFESDVRQRRKEFEDFVREKQNWFNQEMRAFTQKQIDRKKAESQAPR
jgi:hypothetical protein